MFVMPPNWLEKRTTWGISSKRMGTQHRWWAGLSGTTQHLLHSLPPKLKNRSRSPPKFLYLTYVRCVSERKEKVQESWHQDNLWYDVMIYLVVEWTDLLLHLYLIVQNEYTSSHCITYSSSNNAIIPLEGLQNTSQMGNLFSNVSVAYNYHHQGIMTKKHSCI